MTKTSQTYTLGPIIRTGTEFKCAYCRRWVSSGASIHGPCSIGHRDETTRDAEVRHVLQLWEDGKMLMILPVSREMFAASDLLEAAKVALTWLDGDREILRAAHAGTGAIDGAVEALRAAIRKAEGEKP